MHRARNTRVLLVGREAVSGEIRSHLRRQGRCLVQAGPNEGLTSILNAAANSTNIAVAQGRAGLTDVPMACVQSLVGSYESGASVASKAQQLIGRVDLLIIDDAHHADATSIDLLAAAALATRTPILVGAHSPPPSLGPDWPVVKIPRLEDGEVDSVVDAHCPSGLAPTLRRVLTRLADGRGGLLVRLLEATNAIEAGASDEEIYSALLANSWISRHALNLDISRGLAEVADELAIAGPTSVELASAYWDADALSELESLGLIMFDESHEAVRFVDPLVAELRRHAIAALRKRALNKSLAQRAMAAAGSGVEVDTIDLTRLHLDGGLTPDRRTLARAAEEAYRLGMDELAARFTQAFFDGGETGSLLVAGAYRRTGRTREADRVISAAPHLTDDRSRLAAATMRADNLFWGLGDTPAARRVIEQASELCTDPDVRDTLAGAAASYELMSGNVGGAMRCVEGLRDAPIVRVITGIVSGAALATMGRCQEALAAIERGENAAASEPGVELEQHAMLMIARILAQTEAGELQAARQATTAGFDASLEFGSNMGRAWFAMKHARLDMVMGRPRSAAHWWAETAHMFSLIGQHGSSRWGLAGLAWSAGVLGDRTAATDALARLEQADPMGIHFMDAEVHRARAWALATVVGAKAAQDELEAAVAAAASRGQASLEAWALHDLVRFGSRLHSARLGELSDISDSPLIKLCAEHAACVESKSAAGLLWCAEEFSALGARGWAADSAARSLHLGTSADEARAKRIIAACRRETEGAWSPLLQTVDPAPLTPREHQIAVMAATGASNASIASELNVSTRTVESHLRRVYPKLGINSRADLAAALG